MLRVALVNTQKQNTGEFLVLKEDVARHAACTEQRTLVRNSLHNLIPGSVFAARKPNRWGNYSNMHGGGGSGDDRELDRGMENGKRRARICSL
jgi:hypothetical protein